MLSISCVANHGDIVRFTTAVIVEVSYGKTLSGPDDKYVLVSQKFMKAFDASSVPGRYWVEYFPFLRHVPSWVPGTGAKQLQRQYGQCTERLRTDAYDEVRKSLVSYLVLPRGEVILCENTGCWIGKTVHLS